MRHSKLYLLCGAAAIIAPALADAQEVAQGGRLEEILVTARKREENLIDVPMAITAISSATIEKLDIQNMADLAKRTPGMFYTDYGANRADRLYRSFIIRGIAVNNSNNFSDAALLFVDGAPVISGNMPGLLDVERVEVLKGPQAAYFGRNTFSGAVNVATKQPRDHWGASVSAEYGSYQSYDIAASADGPIIADKLGLRLSGEAQGKGGQYKNYLNSNDRLGGQKTESGSGTLRATPTDELAVTLYGSYFVYHDQPGAQVRLINPSLTCDPGHTGKNTWICGKAPRIAPEQIIYNFDLDTRWRNLVLPKSLFGPGGIDDHAGLESRNLHLTGKIDYTLPNAWSFQTITAYDITKAATISDEWYDPNYQNQFFGIIPNVRPTWNWLYLVERRETDFSQEARLSSDQKQRLRWTIGGNYIKLRLNSDVIGDVPLGAPLALPGAQGDAHTWAGFGGIYYDLFPKMELGAEARYQSDYVKNSPVTGNPIFGTFNSFSPRITVKYKPNTDTTVFALWSRGTRPGAFNSTLVPGALPAAAQQQIIAITGASVNVAPERLDDFEIGIKGNFLDDRAYVSLTGYYGKITNQQTSQAYTITQPVVNVGTVLVNQGQTRVDGIELETAFQVTEQLKVTGAFALNNTKILRGNDLSVAPLTGGNSYVIGNRLPNAPRTQGSLEATYTNHLSGSLDWFVTGEYLYIGTKFAETANLFQTGAQNIANARLGVSNQRMRAEIWGRNIFNNRVPDLISVAFNYNTFVGNAAQIALPQKATFGARITYNF